MEQGPTTPRPRPHSRGFSFKSDRSGVSKAKDEHGESPKDKNRRDSVWKGTSKANPNAAINEAQPGVAAVFEESTLQSLRELEHRDASGQLITDPDRSNPTRPRLERPLDTIRSFEKAIDNGYKRRSTYQRTESYDQQQQPQQQPQQQQSHQYNASRRNSGYLGDYNPNAAGQARYAASNSGGYYGNQRPDSYYGNAGSNAQSRNRLGPRMQAEPPTNGQRPYPQHGYHQSQDTMNTGMTNGSDSTGPWANSTDPSSENSSIDRVAAASRPNGDHGYGSNGYGPNGFNNPIPEEGGAYPSGASRSNMQRRPIPLGNSDNASGGHVPKFVQPEPEKKKGWLKRRFSKNP